MKQIWTGTGFASLSTIVAAWVAIGVGSPPPPVCPSSTPNVAGGTDPWGGCWPGVGNTGTPAGTTLTPYTGSCNVTVANTVIDSKVIDCPSGEGACRTGFCMNIQAPGVVIRNSLVNGSVWIDDPAPNYSFTITDTTINVGPINQTENNAPTAIGKSHFVATRVETFNGGRGIWCEYDCKVVDSYIHGQDADEGGATHESGIRQGSGVPNPSASSNGGVQTFTHDTVLCEAPDVPPDAGCSADFTGYGDFNYIQYNTLHRNLLLSSTGGTCAYGGQHHAAAVRGRLAQRLDGEHLPARSSGAWHHRRRWPLRLLVRHRALRRELARKRVHRQLVGHRRDRGSEHVRMI
jgi:hypothetical protein